MIPVKTEKLRIEIRSVLQRDQKSSIEQVEHAPYDLIEPITIIDRVNCCKHAGTRTGQ